MGLPSLPNLHSKGDLEVPGLPTLLRGVEWSLRVGVPVSRPQPVSGKRDTQRPFPTRYKREQGESEVGTCVVEKKRETVGGRKGGRPG